jgi:hypothetical protein
LAKPIITEAFEQETKALIANGSEARPVRVRLLLILFSKSISYPSGKLIFSIGGFNEQLVRHLPTYKKQQYLETHGHY